MIASVQGLVVGIEEDALIVQVGGVGLLVYVPAQVAAQYQ